MTLFPIAASIHPAVAVGATMLLLVSLLSILLVVVGRSEDGVMWIRMGELIEAGDVELDERFKDHGGPSLMRSMPISRELGAVLPVGTLSRFGRFIAGQASSITSTEMASLHGE